MAVHVEGNPLHITIDGEVVEQVKQFGYLGSLILDTFKAEFKRRIAMAKTAIKNKREL